jgi:hypothetical protein
VLEGEHDATENEELRPRGLERGRHLVAAQDEKRDEGQCRRRPEELHLMERVVGADELDDRVLGGAHGDRQKEHADRLQPLARQA